MAPDYDALQRRDKRAERDPVLRMLAKRVHAYDLASDRRASAA